MPRLIGFIVMYLIVSGLGACPMNSEAVEPLLTLQFVPFRIETYLPISREQLEKGDPIVFMKEHKFIEELLSLLEAHPTGEHLEREAIFYNLRLKADFAVKAGAFFASKGGAVLREKDGMIFRLSQKEMDLLDERIEYFKGVVDTNAAKRYMEK